MHRISFFIFILLTILTVKLKAQKKFIPCNHSSIYYQGRISEKENSIVFSWPGNSATITFKGTNIYAILKDEDTCNYYNVIVDNEVVNKIHTDTIKKSYLLANGLSNKKHIVQLFKRTEWDKGKTFFYGFETNKQTKILPTTKNINRKIEFYGNSITCGYAIEDSSLNDSWHGYFENNYLTYAALTARHFNAAYSNVSKSGIGLMISWGPLIMPEMYDRIDAKDTLLKWDFKKYVPDIVVVNILQNDSWLINMPNYVQFKNRFGSKVPSAKEIIIAYKDFINKIRSKYKAAHIICTLGNMDATKVGAPWTKYIEKAVLDLNDPKTYTHFFAFKNTNDHPKIAEHKSMAESLIAFIDKNIKW